MASSFEQGNILPRLDLDYITHFKVLPGFAVGQAFHSLSKDLGTFLPFMLSIYRSRTEPIVWISKTFMLVFEAMVGGRS